MPLKYKARQKLISGNWIQTFSHWACSTSKKSTEWRCSVFSLSMANPWLHRMQQCLLCNCDILLFAIFVTKCWILSVHSGSAKGSHHLSHCFTTLANICCFQLLTGDDFWTQSTMIINWLNSKMIWTQAATFYRSWPFFFKTLARFAFDLIIFQSRWQYLAMKTLSLFRSYWKQLKRPQAMETLSKNQSNGRNLLKNLMLCSLNRKNLESTLVAEIKLFVDKVNFEGVDLKKNRIKCFGSVIHG